MADLLSNRADAYARAFTSGLGLGRVLFNDLYRYTFFFFFFFFCTASTRSGDVLFLRRQSRTHPERGPGALLEIAGDTRQVHIFLRRRNRRGTRSRRVCARSFRRVEKKGGRGGKKKEKEKLSRAHFTHTHAPFLVARRGQNAPRRPNYYPRRVLAIVRGIREKSREKNISPS